MAGFVVGVGYDVLARKFGTQPDPHTDAIPEAIEATLADAPEETRDDDNVHFDNRNPTPPTASCGEYADEPARYVEKAPQLQSAVNALDDLARREDPLFVQGIKFWGGRLVALFIGVEAGDAPINVSVTSQAMRFRRQAVTLANQCRDQLLVGHSQNDQPSSYAVAVTDAAGGVEAALGSIVTSIEVILKERMTVKTDTA